MNRFGIFRNKHRGERIFIVGSGKSLINTPLDLIKHELSFGLNNIAKIYDDTKWRPSYYLLATAYIADPQYKVGVMQSIDLGIPCFICEKLRSMLPEFDQFDHLYFFDCLHTTIEKPEPQYKWWNPANLDQGFLSNFGQSTFSVSQICAYMGARQIILLGCDMDYTYHKPGTPDPNHFSDDYETGKFEQPYEFWKKEMPRRFKSHEIMNRMAAENGIEILNATAGGKLECYERVELESLF